MPKSDESRAASGTESTPDAVDPTAGRWRRRAVLAGGAVAVTAWVVGIPRLGGLRSSRLTFQAISGLAPFRTLEAIGTLSTAAGLLIGMDADQPPDAAGEAMIAEVRACPPSAPMEQFSMIA